MTLLHNIFARTSAVRIIAWTVFIFIALCILADTWVDDPPQTNKSVEIMGTAVGDPRVVRREVTRQDDELLVAWVTDSSPTILRLKKQSTLDFDRVGFVHDKILKRIPVVEGRPLRFAIYMQIKGPKALDKYYEAQHALTLKPDLLIYGVNPTFDFTSWSMLGIPEAPGALYKFSDNHSVKWTYLFASPAQLIQSKVSEWLPALEKRFIFGKWVQRYRVAFDPFGYRKAPRPQGAIWEMLLLRGKYTNATPVTDPAVIPGSQLRQLLAMRLMDLSKEGWGKQILRTLVEDIRKAGVPALIYIIPVNIQAIEADPIAGGNFHKFEAWFSDFAAVNSGNGITIIPKTPSRFLKGLSYYDISHLTAPNPFIDYMTKEIAQDVQPRN